MIRYAHCFGRTGISAEHGQCGVVLRATKTALHLIEPIGLKLGDVQLKRTGIVYWQLVERLRWPNSKAFEEKHPANAIGKAQELSAERLTSSRFAQAA